MNRKRLARSTAALFLVSLMAGTCSDAEAPDAVQASASPAPRLRLRLSGFMEGHLEPCGCAGGQLGGLPRRTFLLRQNRDHDVLIEGGNLIGGATPLDVQKLLTALTVLSLPQAEYDAIGVGPKDLACAELTTFLSAMPATALSSDVIAEDDASWPIKPWFEKEVGDGRVRIASLTLSLPDPPPEGLRLLEPAAAWERAMADADPSTYRVLLVHGSPEAARAQAALTPQPDLLVCVTDEISEPQGQPDTVAGVPLVFSGVRGRMLVDLVLARIDGKPQVTRYEILHLAGSETAKGALEDPDAKAVVLQHRHDVQREGIREQMAERMPTTTGASYVGTSACKDCHQEAYDKWLLTKHGHAWETLEKAETGTRYGWPVTAYPDCVRCHTVGYGYQSGFVNPEKTPDLRSVGCEECHGPGSVHVETTAREDIQRSDINTCLTCHDFEQSPDFRAHYAERWKEIEHR
jgi:2',3'-cyclic-nucleotide 2'-phosphodiesterase (5'-nucleotidase family)